MRTLSVFILMLVGLAGCGPTVGDPCTTTADCGGAECLNRAFAPGGYCSKACSSSAGHACPSGTVCVRDALGRHADGCLRACVAPKDCRVGYTCVVANDSVTTVCLGPAGL
jgi:hypothetical protein